MHQQKSGLFQIGLAVVLIGLSVKIALFVGMMLSPLAWWAIVIGAILMIVGLVSPGRGSY